MKKQAHLFKSCVFALFTQSILIISACTGTSFSGSGRVTKQPKEPEKIANVPTVEQKKDNSVTKNNTPVENKTTPIVTPTTTEQKNTAPIINNNTNNQMIGTNELNNLNNNNNNIIQTNNEMNNNVQPSDGSNPFEHLKPSFGDKVVGNLFVEISPIANMEHQKHATDPGVWALLAKDGRLIAAGPLTLETACQGWTSGNSTGYPTAVFNINLLYVAPEVENGSLSGSQTGQLSICKVQDPNAHPSALACQSDDGNNDADRPVYWFDRQYEFTVNAKNQIELGNFNAQGNGFSLTDDSGFAGGDSSGFGSFGNGNSLSMFHPLTAGPSGNINKFGDYNSPLVLDLNNNGSTDLFNVWKDKKDIKFDLTGHGMKSLTGWVKPSDGLLALDLDTNGTIDNGSELFGEYSNRLQPKDKWTVLNFENGFLALTQYDDNKDGIIDAKDKVFQKLVIWQDLNSDGIAQKNEIKPLSTYKIASISLAYKKAEDLQKEERVGANIVKLISSYKTMDGKTHMIADVWFAQKSDGLAKNIVNKSK